MMTFELFPDQWTPVERSALVPRGGRARVEIAGEAVVLFRDRSGRLGALLDRCPHRGVALSLGRVTDEGTLECPFHGWKFDHEGHCTQVPFACLDESKRARLAATAVPVREIAGLVWLYTGSEPAGEPELPEAFTESGWAHDVHVETWSTHWTRAMENMLDYPHLPYVHRRSIGRGLRGPAERGGELALSHEMTSFGMTISATVEGRSSGAGLEWRRPNGMVLLLPAGPGRRVRQHVWCVPVGPTSTRMILVSSRDFALVPPLSWFFRRTNTFILGEDRAVVESSQPPEVPPAREEKSVASDAPTLAFRRWYDRTLRGGRSAEPDVKVTALSAKRRPLEVAS